MIRFVLVVSNVLLLLSCCVQRVAPFSVPTPMDSLHMVGMTTAVQTVGHFGSDLLDTYKQTLMEHPLPTKMMTGATLSVAGDAMAQSRQQQQPSEAFSYDTTRATSFALFDMTYRALQHVAFPMIRQECHGQWLSNPIATVMSIVPATTIDTTAAAAAMEQALASQLLIVPFLYYPVFFLLTGTIQGLSIEKSIHRGMENFIPLMKRNLLFWIPIQFIQFGYIEESLQIPFLSVCGLVWTFILSYLAGSTKQYTTSTAATTSPLSVSDAITSTSQGKVPTIVVVDHYTRETFEQDDATTIVNRDELLPTSRRQPGRNLVGSKV